MANITQVTLIKVKIGMPVSYECLTKICRVLHCELYDIFDEVE